MNNNTLSPLQKTVVGAQFLFVAFGATVLVPLLVGLDPSVALLTAGVGTLIFHAVTKGKVPVFLGSSFAFIAPIIKATELFGLPGTLCGLVSVGLVYGVMSLLIRLRGVGFIARLFPPIVVGPVIMLIGLSLAGTGVNMAKEKWWLALVALFRLWGLIAGVILLGVFVCTNKTVFGKRKYLYPLIPFDKRVLLKHFFRVQKDDFEEKCHDNVNDSSK